MSRDLVPLARWRAHGRRLLGIVLGTSGTVLITAGRILILCGLLTQTLRARIGPP